MCLVSFFRVTAYSAANTTHVIYRLLPLLKFPVAMVNCNRTPVPAVRLQRDYGVSPIRASVPSTAHSAVAQGETSDRDFNRLYSAPAIGVAQVMLSQTSTNCIPHSNLLRPRTTSPPLLSRSTPNDQAKSRNCESRPWHQPAKASIRTRFVSLASA